MSLDPSDLHLRIEADVSAPGAEQAAQQIRGAGRAADEARASFDRLRQTSASTGAQQVVAAPPVNAPTYDPVSGRDATVANQLVRSLVQQREATETVFKNAMESVRRSTGVSPTIRPEDLGITPAPVVQAADSGGGRSGRGRANGTGGGETEDAGAGARRVRQEVEGLDEPLKRAQRGASGLSGVFNLSEQSLTRAGLALVGVGAGLNALVTVASRVHSEIAASVDAAVELDRVGRALQATYRASTGGISMFAGSLAVQAGVSSATAQQGLVAAGLLTNQFGLTTAQVQQLSTRAADLAGARGEPFDKTFQAVTQAVQSGGNGLEQYGVRLDDTYLKTNAFNGALASTFDRFTQAQQVAARFNVFLDQTRDIQGSAATAANTLSGSLDKLGGSFQRLREQSGELGAGGLQGPAQALSGFLDQITSGLTRNDRRSIVSDQNAPGGARIVSGSPQFDLAGASAALGLNAPPGPRAFIGPIPVRPADLAAAQATEAQRFAGGAQAEAQAGVTTLNLTDQQRELDRAGELASLRTETLAREGNILDLQRQEADLADRMALAGRENLDLLRQQTQARLDSLGASNRLNDLQYDTQHTSLQIQAIRSDVRRGALDPSALEQIPELRQQLRADQLATPRAQLQALEANRPADLASRGVQQDQLQVALRQIPLETQNRALQDELAPQQQQQRGTDERTQGVNRELELARLAEEPQRTTAERNVLAATAVALAADQSVRSAQEWAQGIHDGLTDLERAWQITQSIAPGPGALTAGMPAADMSASARADAAGQAIIAGGGSVQDATAAAGRAYADPTGGGGDRITINVTVGGSNASPQQITSAVLSALNQRAQRGPRAAPRTLVGAR
jgi:hypothetical protein